MFNLRKKRLLVASLVCLAALPFAAAASAKLDNHRSAKRYRPSALTTPQITGETVVGNTLSSSAGTWTNAPTTFSYTWLRCNRNGTGCWTIDGASGDSYVLTTADIARTLRVKVAAQNGYGSGSARSDATTQVQLPRDTTPPTTPTDLRAVHVTDVSVTVRWSRATDDVRVTDYDVSVDGTDQGSTKPPRLTLSGLQCGSTHTIDVVAFDAAGNRSAPAELTISTTACPPPPAPPANTVLPSISGTAEVGETLTSSDGSWGGTTPISLSFAWLLCDAAGSDCQPIADATSADYTAAAGDAGHTLRSKVTATNAAGTATAMSTPSQAVVGVPTKSALSGLYVSGNKFVDGYGQVVHLHGVNRSGPEYACVQGWGIFDGPSDDASVAAMASWRVNIVRVPLNEDCWLGINDIAPDYAGATYRQAIVDYVNLLHTHGMYAELSLIWAAPGSYQATYQSGGPDEDHSPAFWASLAATFKDDPNVILAPWGETVTGWTCFMQTGCDDQATYGPNNDGYQTASMQQAVDVMRGAGFHGPIAIPCVAWANLCDNYNGSSWVASHPTDPDGQLVAEAHVYGKNECSSVDCFNRDYLPIVQKFPMIFGETGESYDDSDCGSSAISTFIDWADANGVGYEAWTWDTWGTCGSLISSYDGTPANAFGTWVRDHYVASF